MKKVLASLVLAAAAFAGDPSHLLPYTKVTLHANLNAYDACFAVAKLLGAQVTISYVADLKSSSTQFKIDLDNVPGATAFDTITAMVNKMWGTQRGTKPGEIIVIVQDPPPPPK